MAHAGDDARWITLLDANTGQPVTAGMVKYGLSLNVLGLPAHRSARTLAAIELVGPRYFRARRGLPAAARTRGEIHPRGRGNSASVRL